jgi:hypothetical protein
MMGDTGWGRRNDSKIPKQLLSARPDNFSEVPTSLEAHMPEATHYLKLPRPVGTGFDLFWLDPEAHGCDVVRGNDGWDEQCPNCGQTVNESYTFLGLNYAQCECGQSVELCAAASCVR